MSDRQMTPEQSHAVHTIDRPVALLAGAGSGKTTVLVDRYIEILKTGTLPRNILTVTFTNEAADQLRHRISKRLNDLGGTLVQHIESVESSPFIGTIHGFCYTLIERYGSVIGLAPIERVLSGFEVAAFFDREYRQWLDTLPSDRLRFWLEYFTHAEFRTMAREVYNNRFLFARSLNTPKTTDADKTELIKQFFEDLKPFLALMEKATIAQGLYTFDELENYAYNILANSEETTSKLQSDLRYVLIDEFQDTSRLQWQILRRIVGENHKKLFIVGDPKQSIYSFRQADVGVFLRLASRFPTQGGELQQLTTNFRSAPELLEGINQLSRTFFENALIPFAPMDAPTPLLTTPDFHSTVKIRRYPVVGKKSDAVSEEIAEVITETKTLLSQGVAPRDITLLFRVSDRLPEYFAAFSKENIPCRGTKGQKLFQNYDVLDICNFIKAVNNPLDDYALTAFLRSSFANMSPWSLWEINQGEKKPLYEKLLLLSPNPVAWFCEIVESGEFEIESLLHELFQKSGYLPTSQEAVMEFLDALHPKWNAAEASQQIIAWEKEDLSYQSEQVFGSEPGVRLMTVHASKGLEFPHVFLVDCLRQSSRRSPALRVHPDFFPGLKFRDPATQESQSTASYDKIEQYMRKQEGEEMRRILYVAVTRAQKTLTVFLPDDPTIAPTGSWGDWLERAILESSRK